MKTTILATILAPDLLVLLAEDEWLTHNKNQIEMKHDIAWHGTKVYVLKVLRSIVLNRCHDVKQAEWPHNTQTLDTSMAMNWSANIRQQWDSVRIALKKAQDAYKTQSDKKRADQKPYNVVWTINLVTVHLQLPSRFKHIHPVFHISLLKPADMSWQEPRLTTPGPICDDHYEIDDILDSHCRWGVLQYLVSWKGYPVSEASWIPCTDVAAPRLRRRFHRKYPLKAGAGGKGKVILDISCCHVCHYRNNMCRASAPPAIDARHPICSRSCLPRCPVHCGRSSLLLSDVSLTRESR
ncbi:putative chromo domain-containing protein LHP1, partial [Ophiophagus hannah]